MAGGTVDGLISGLDTSTIVKQLMEIERAPAARLEQRKAKEEAKVAAYQSVNTKLAALQTASDTLSLAASWSAFKATSSSTSVVASAGTTALPGTYRFDVLDVAGAQSYISNTTWGSTSSQITAASTITITKGAGTPVDIEVNDGSLASVVSAVNAANAGVRAAAIQVAPGSYRLSLTSTTTGAASDFTVTAGIDPMPLGALDELSAGKDAVIGVGDPLAAGYFTVTSASNTIADVVPGVTLTVKAPVNDVILEVSADGEALAAKVDSVVKALNAAIVEIDKLTKYDVATGKGGALVGDSTLRAIKQRLLSTVSAPITGSLSTAGIELSKDGTVAFDKAVFDKAFAADPAALARQFRPGGSMTHSNPTYASLPGKVAFMRADDRTLPGTYRVTVTNAASRASVRLAGAVAAGEDLTLTVPGKSPVHVVADPGDGLAELAGKINVASATEGLGLVAAVESGDLIIRTIAYGTAPTVTASTTGTLVVDPTVAGTNVAGTINGVVANGIGQVLTAPTSDTTLWGLSLLVTANAADVALAAGQAGADAGLFGEFTYKPGFSQRLDSAAGDAVRTGTGRLTTLITGASRRVDDLDDEIAAFDQRLVLREVTLRRQFTNLETALGKMQQQSSWLAGQIAGLMANTANS